MISSQHLSCAARRLLWAAPLISLSSMTPAQAAAPTVTAPSARPATLKLPLHFEANQGQTDSSVRFLSRGSGYTLFLTDTEAVLTLRRPAGVQRASLGAEAPLDVLRLKLLGAAPRPQVTGEEKLPGRTHRLHGNNPREWKTNISQWSRVRHQAVYPGIDLVFHGRQGQLEYDFEVAPHIDPSHIQVQLTGARVARINAEGDLILDTSGGQLVQHAPVAFQEVDGQRRAVAARFDLKKQPNGTHRLGFKLGRYDQTQALVIDPILSYSTYLGGSGSDYATAVTADAAGNAYVTGYTNSANFPKVGALQTTTRGGDEVFVSKINAAGTALAYSTYLGGSALDQAAGIAVDSTGCTYVAGRTASSNFPVLGAWQTTKSTGNDAFVVKLNAAGSALVYGTYLGGTGNDSAEGIAVNELGQAHVTGYTDSTGASFSGGFPTSAPLQSAKAGGLDAFVTKLNAAGNGAVYSTYIGGTNSDQAVGIGLDATGNAVVAGYTNSTNYKVTLGVHKTGLTGTYDGFVSKLSPTGTSLVYSTYIGGSGMDQLYAVAVDGAGSAYVTGFSNSSNYPVTVGAFRTTRTGNAFVSKLNPTGTGLVYSSWLGMTGDSGNGIAVDSLGRASVTGYTNATIVPTTRDAVQTATGGSYDAFLLQFNATGNGLLYGSFLGGVSDDVAKAVAVDAAGDAYVVGYTASNNYPTTGTAPQSATGGGTDGFLTKIALSVTLQAPGTPTNLNKRLTLVWGDADTTEQGFEIEQSVNGGAFTPLATTGPNVTSYTVSTLDAGATYQFRVRAFNAVGKSPYSNVIAQ